MKDYIIEKLEIAKEKKYKEISEEITDINNNAQLNTEILRSMIWNDLLYKYNQRWSDAVKSRSIHPYGVLSYSVRLTSVEAMLKEHPGWKFAEEAKLYNFTHPNSNDHLWFWVLNAKEVHPVYIGELLTELESDGMEIKVAYSDESSLEYKISIAIDKLDEIVEGSNKLKKTIDKEVFHG